MAALDSILNISFAASLRTDEGRPARFQLSIKNFEPTTNPDISFEPIPLTPDSVARLSHAAPPGEMLISTVVNPNGTLSINGLRKAPPWYGPSDLTFSIAAVGPAVIRVYFGSVELLSYNAGEVQPSIASFFSATWGDPETLKRPSLLEVRNRVHKDAACRASDDALLRLLREVARQRHGGLVLIDGTCSEPATIGKPAYLPISTVDLGAQLRSALSAYSDLIGSRYVTSLADPREPSRWPLNEDPAKRAKYGVAFSALNQDIIKVANLCALDGAVLLDGGLVLRSFGFRVALHGEPPEVYRVTSSFTAEWPKFDLDRHGTRHQAAAMFAASSPKRFALICSADGPTAVVAQIGGCVAYWPVRLGPL